MLPVVTWPKWVKLRRTHARHSLPNCRQITDIVRPRGSWAIQAHGGAGVSEDFGLAHAYAHARALRLADGPDEVHRNQIAKLEISEQTSVPVELSRGVG